MMTKKAGTTSAARLARDLQARGLRATAQRLQIARQVLGKHQHFTADELIAWSARCRLKLSRATVYNTLNEFVAVGLLRSFYSVRDEKLIFDSNTSKHFHFLDTVSNEMFDIEPGLCVLNTSALKGYVVEEAEVFLRGKRLRS